MDSDFDDLFAANEEFAASFELSGFDGVAHAGVAIVTCMDSRIDPLGMVGLSPGDAKIFRNPGGRVTNAALEALVIGVHLLSVERILIVPHTRCAMATNTEAELRAGQCRQRPGCRLDQLAGRPRPGRRAPRRRGLGSRHTP